MHTAQEWAESSEAFRQDCLGTGKAQGTSRNFAATLRRFGQWAFSCDLDPLICDPVGYLAQRRGQVSDRSVYNEGVALRSFLRWHGEAERAQTLRVRFPPSSPQPPFSDEEITRLLSVATARERDLCLLLLVTGLRARELVTARDMGELACVVGKGGKVGYVALPFPLDGIVPKSYPMLWRMVSKLGKRAGVHAYPRRFRTSHAHLLLRSYDLQTVQLSMRHARITTTALYTRWDAESRALRAQRKLAKAILETL